MTQTLSVIDPEVLSIDERAALEANIDNLTKVLRVSKEKVYNYRERYIQEENIEREKYGNK